MVKTIVKGRLVLPDQLVQGELWIEDGSIVAVIREGERAPQTLEVLREQFTTYDFSGLDILPGLIDLHGDAFEKALQPRKGVIVPVQWAMRSFQSSLLAAGITTVFHGVSFAGESGVRTNEMSMSVSMEIQRLKSDPDALMRHRLHARLEYTNPQGVTLVKTLLDEDALDFLSVMDHSPLYGKYKNPSMYLYYLEKTYQLTGPKAERELQEKITQREQVDESAIEQLVREVVQAGIAVASHDDDSAERVCQMHAAGASVSEFPLNEQAAGQAIDLGMDAVIGAPNVLRGKSHEDHLSGRYALENGLANVMCSDYYPQSMLAAVYIMSDQGMPLENAVKTVTCNPAKAAGLHHLGALRAGAAADLIVVKRSNRDQMPMVLRAMVNGKWNLIIGS